jgi:hypothetical protein
MKENGVKNMIKLRLIIKLSYLLIKLLSIRKHDFFKIFNYFMYNMKQSLVHLFNLNIVYHDKV